MAGLWQKIILFLPIDLAMVGNFSVTSLQVVVPLTAGSAMSL